MDPFEKIVNPGRFRRYQGARNTYPVFCKIEYGVHSRSLYGGKVTDKPGKEKLSITGVEGPTMSGNCRGRVGQIYPVEVEKLGPGWTRAMLAEFNAVWARWHLNDTRPGCEHQTGPEWEPGRMVELVEVKMHWNKQREMEKAAEEHGQRAFGIVPNVRDLETLEKLAGNSYAAAILWRLKRLDVEMLGATMPETRLKAEREWLRTWVDYPEDEETILALFDSAVSVTPKRERAGSVYERDGGILTKPCEACGYRWGSAWRYQSVPDDVLQFLANLPDTTIAPAWV